MTGISNFYVLVFVGTVYFPKLSVLLVALDKIYSVVADRPKNIIFLLL